MPTDTNTETENAACDRLMPPPPTTDANGQQNLAFEDEENKTEEKPPLPTDENVEMVNMNPYGGVKAEKDKEDPTTYRDYFVPVNTHRKFLRGEKLYLAQNSRSSHQRPWRKIVLCGIIWTFVAAIFLAAALAATGIIASKSTDESTEDERRQHYRSNHTDHDPKTFTLDSSLYLLSTNNLNRVTDRNKEIKGNFRIDNEQFLPSYSDINSPESLQLTELLETQLMNIFSRLNVTKVKIENLLPGSVIVDYTVQVPPSVSSEDVYEELISFLNQHQDFIDRYLIDRSSVSIQGISNPAEEIVSSTPQMERIPELTTNSPLEETEVGTTEMDKNFESLDELPVIYHILTSSEADNPQVTTETSSSNYDNYFHPVTDTSISYVSQTDDFDAVTSSPNLVETSPSHTTEIGTNDTENRLGFARSLFDLFNFHNNSKEELNQTEVNLANNTQTITPNDVTQSSLLDSDTSVTSDITLSILLTSQRTFIPVLDVTTQNAPEPEPTTLIPPFWSIFYPHQNNSNNTEIDEDVLLSNFTNTEAENTTAMNHQNITSIKATTIDLSSDVLVNMYFNSTHNPLAEIVNTTTEVNDMNSKSSNDEVGNDEWDMENRFPNDLNEFIITESNDKNSTVTNETISHNSTDAMFVLSNPSRPSPGAFNSITIMIVNNVTNDNVSSVAMDNVTSDLNLKTDNISSEMIDVNETSTAGMETMMTDNISLELINTLATDNVSSLVDDTVTTENVLSMIDDSVTNSNVSSMATDSVTTDSPSSEIVDIVATDNVSSLVAENVTTDNVSTIVVDNLTTDNVSPIVDDNATTDNVSSIENHTVTTDNASSTVAENVTTDNVSSIAAENVTVDNVSSIAAENVTTDNVIALMTNTNITDLVSSSVADTITTDHISLIVADDVMPDNNQSSVVVDDMKTDNASLLITDTDNLGLVTNNDTGIFSTMSSNNLTNNNISTTASNVLSDDVLITITDTIIKYLSTMIADNVTTVSSMITDTNVTTDIMSNNSMNHNSEVMTDNETTGKSYLMEVSDATLKNDIITLNHTTADNELQGINHNVSDENMITVDTISSTTATDQSNASLMSYNKQNLFDSSVHYFNITEENLSENFHNSTALAAPSAESNPSSNSEISTENNELLISSNATKLNPTSDVNSKFNDSNDSLTSEVNITNFLTPPTLTVHFEGFSNENQTMPDNETIAIVTTGASDNHLQHLLNNSVTSNETKTESDKAFDPANTSSNETSSMEPNMIIPSGRSLPFDKLEDKAFPHSMNAILSSNETSSTLNPEQNNSQSSSLSNGNNNNSINTELQNKTEEEKLLENNIHPLTPDSLPLNSNVSTFQQGNASQPRIEEIYIYPGDNLSMETNITNTQISPEELESLLSMEIDNLNTNHSENLIGVQSPSNYSSLEKSNFNQSTTETVNGNVTLPSITTTKDLSSNASNKIFFVGIDSDNENQTVATLSKDSISPPLQEKSNDTTVTTTQLNINSSTTLNVEINTPESTDYFGTSPLEIQQVTESTTVFNSDVGEVAYESSSTATEANETTMENKSDSSSELPELLPTPAALKQNSIMPPCHRDQFECTSGSISCIAKIKQCDGRPDCTDASDESGCEVTSS